MEDENLGNFFDAFDDNEDSQETWKPIKIHGNALYKKAIEILNLTVTICDLFVEDDDQSETTKKLMMENALLIPAKIKGGMAIDETYSLVMENAVIIKVNICELKAQLWACEVLHEIDKEYIAVLHNEINLFRQLFVDWVSSFSRDNDLPDEWHLFNDPSTFPTTENDDAEH